MKGRGAEVGPGAASLEMMIKRPSFKLGSDLDLLTFIYGFKPHQVFNQVTRSTFYQVEFLSL